MTKLKFLLSLHEKLSGLPQQDVEERLTFYSEMIEDRMEEGLSEEEAVAQVGSVDEITAQIIAEIPTAKKEQPKAKRRFKAWEIVLLALGSPVWLSLLIATFAVVLSIYVSLWAIVVSLWAIFAALIGVIFGITIFGILHSCIGSRLPGIAMIAVGIICVGLSIFLFYGCKAATKGSAHLARIVFISIKTKCRKKEEA